jgi:hypothetical protein
LLVRNWYGCAVRQKVKFLGETRTSSRLLEERQEREQAEAVAAALGIPPSDLEELDWIIEPHESDDGVLYGYNSISAKAQTARIEGLTDGRWVRIGPII